MLQQFEVFAKSLMFKQVDGSPVTCVSTENSAEEFLGLNFHCLDEHFKNWCFSIGLQTFNDRKTAPAILREWIKCFIEWGFLDIIAEAPLVVQIEGLEVPNVNAYKRWQRIYGVIADNGPNVQAACDYLPLEILDESPPCLAHSSACCS